MMTTSPDRMPVFPLLSLPQELLERVMEQVCPGHDCESQMYVQRRRFKFALTIKTNQSTDTPLGARGYLES
jgi:hypothetical protein